MGGTMPPCVPVYQPQSTQPRPLSTALCEQKIALLPLLALHLCLKSCSMATDPICGHYFWDNNDGATTVCQGLGYGGFSSGTHTKTRTTYSTDAMAVGECSAGQALTSCNHGGNGWGNLEYGGGWCKAGTQIGVTVTCN